MATTTYKSTVGPAQIGGVDHSGAPHAPLVFDDELTIDDDMQEYTQTLKHALESGAIEVVSKPTSKTRER